MGKRHPHLPAWQWRSNPQRHQRTASQAAHLMGTGIMVVAFLLLASGIFSANASSAVIGLIALFGALALQRQARTSETKDASSKSF